MGRRGCEGWAGWQAGPRRLPIAASASRRPVGPARGNPTGHRWEVTRVNPERCLPRDAEAAHQLGPPRRPAATAVNRGVDWGVGDPPDRVAPGAVRFASLPGAPVPSRREPWASRPGGSAGRGSRNSGSTRAGGGIGVRVLRRFGEGCSRLKHPPTTALQIARPSGRREGVSGSPDRFRGRFLKNSGESPRDCPY